MTFTLAWVFYPVSRSAGATNEAGLSQRLHDAVDQAGFGAFLQVQEFHPDLKSAACGFFGAPGDLGRDAQLARMSSFEWREDEVQLAAHGKFMVEEKSRSTQPQLDDMSTSVLLGVGGPIDGYDIDVDAKVPSSLQIRQASSFSFVFGNHRGRDSPESPIGNRGVFMPHWVNTRWEK